MSLAVARTILMGAGLWAAEAAGPAPPAAEMAAFRAAKPAFAQHCFRCHTSGGAKSKPRALRHMNMDQYPFGGHHAGSAGSVVRKVVSAPPGTRPKMPSDDPGAVAGDALARMLAWADA